MINFCPKSTKQNIVLENILDHGTCKISTSTTRWHKSRLLRFYVLFDDHMQVSILQQHCERFETLQLHMIREFFMWHDDDNQNNEHWSEWMLIRFYILKIIYLYPIKKENSEIYTECIFLLRFSLSFCIFIKTKNKISVQLFNKKMGFAHYNSVTFSLQSS